MGKNKLAKFAEVATFPNTYQNYDVNEPILLNHEQDEVDLKGKWQTEHFKNDLPVVLELACGGGEYTVAMAREMPYRNYIGVDIKGARIWRGAKIALEEHLQNAAFLRTRIEQLDLFFGPDEVDEIWITFPDPFLRKSKSKHRLTSTRFLPIYQKLLKKGGLINLKTDDETLYEFTLETISETNCTLIYHHNDIYGAARKALGLTSQIELSYRDGSSYAHMLYTPELQYRTYYEQMHLSNEKTIKFIRFTLEGLRIAAE